jgi:hypothetical protein
MTTASNLWFGMAARIFETLSSACRSGKEKN